MDSGADITLISLKYLRNLKNNYNFQFTLHPSKAKRISLADEKAHIYVQNTVIIPHIWVHTDTGLVEITNLEAGVVMDDNVDITELIIGKPALQTLGIMPIDNIKPGLYDLRDTPYYSDNPTSQNKWHISLKRLKTDTDKLDKPVVHFPVLLSDDAIASEEEAYEKEDPNIAEKAASARKKYNITYPDLSKRITFKENKFQKKSELIQAIYDKFDQYLAIYSELLDEFGADECMTPQDYFEFVLEYQDIMRTKFGGDPPAKVTPMPFEWKSNERPSHSKNAIPLTKEEAEWVEKHYDVLIASGVMQKVLPGDPTPECSCPVFLVNKPEPGEYRLIEDFRKINQFAKDFGYPLPNLETITSMLLGMGVFGTLDCLKGYNQFPVSPECYNVFICMTTRGLFRFLRIPMGFKNSVAWYQHIMADEVLRGLYFKTCIGYLDDIKPFGKTPKDYFQRLREIFDRFRKFGVKINLKKCTFISLQVLYCGKVFSKKGVRISDVQVEAINNLAVPVTVGELQHYYCSTNWLRPSILNYAIKAAPIHDLLEANIKHYGGNRKKNAIKTKPIVGWSSKEYNSFLDVKEGINQGLIRAYPDPNKPRHILLDASLEFWSLLITQTDPSENHLPIHERKHELLHIQSGRFRKSQTNWHITSKEAFPLIEAARNIRYLMHISNEKGEVFPIHIWTDHKNLLSVFNPNDVPNWKRHTVERLLRWGLELSGVYYVIHHIPGQLNLLPDYISRKFSVTTTPSCKRLRVAGPLRFTHKKKRKRTKEKPSIDLDARRIFRQNRIQAHLDADSIWPNETKLLKLQAEYSKRKDFVKNQLFLVDGKPLIPTTYIPNLIIASHYILGHCGTDTALNLLLDKYSFELTKSDLATLCKEFNRECLHCRPRYLKRKMPLGKVYRATKRFGVIHFDFLFIAESTVGHRYLLVIMDDYSNLLQLIPATDCNTEETVFALLDFYAQHGFHVNVTFVSDNATSFTSELLDKFCKLKNIYHRYSIAYAPFSNGVAERPNQDILQIFRSLLSQLKLPLMQWPKLISVVESILNHRPRKRLGNRSPISVAHNIPMEDIMSGLEFSSLADNDIITFDMGAVEKDFQKLTEFFENFHQNRKSAREAFLTKIEADNFNKYVNFCQGDYVLVAVTPTRLKSKLQFRWQGPARILELSSPHMAKIQFLGQDKTFDYHTCFLAFYSDSLDGQECTVEEQFLFDNKSFDIEEFLSLTADALTNELMVQVVWQGTGGVSSQETFQQLLKDVPSRLLEWVHTLPDTHPLKARALAIFQEGGDITVEDQSKTKRRKRKRKKRESGK